MDGKRLVISILVVLALVYLGPIGLGIMIAVRPSWWKNSGVKIATISWAAIYSLGILAAIFSLPTAIPETAQPASPGIMTPDEESESGAQLESTQDEEDKGEQDDAQHATESEHSATATSTQTGSSSTNPTPAQAPASPSNDASSSSHGEASSGKTPSSPADTNATSATPLPLKAICEDGAVSYQDDPYGENYKGMCSGHGGIAERLGRVK